jgi:hypothetical protein
MPRVTETAPPRLLSVEAIDLDGTGFVALVTLETDDGAAEIAVNRSGALELASLMLEFLAKDPVKRRTSRAARKKG